MLEVSAEFGSHPEIRHRGGLGPRVGSRSLYPLPHPAHRRTVEDSDERRSAWMALGIGRSWIDFEVNIPPGPCSGRDKRPVLLSAVCRSGPETEPLRYEGRRIVKIGQTHEVGHRDRPSTREDNEPLLAWTISGHPWRPADRQSSSSSISSCADEGPYARCDLDSLRLVGIEQAQSSLEVADQHGHEPPPRRRAHVLQSQPEPVADANASRLVLR